MPGFILCISLCAAFYGKMKWRFMAFDSTFSNPHAVLRILAVKAKFIDKFA